MDNVDLNVLRQVTTWLAQGHRVVLGTITRTWGSAPRPPGSSVALRDDGLVAGSVSGGCIEDDLVDKARAGALTTGLPQVVRYGIDTDTAQRFGLPCGGLIELVLEPVQPRTRLDALLAKLDAGERVRRVLTIATGEVDLQPGNTTDELTLSDTTLVTHHGPRWRLLLIGAGQMTQYLAQMAAALDYQVLVCDPREEYATGFAVPGATLLPGDAPRPALAAAADRRRTDDAVPGADGRGAGLPGAGLRPARGVRHRLRRARRHPAAQHARRHGHRHEARRPHGHHRPDP